MDKNNLAKTIGVSGYATKRFIQAMSPTFMELGFRDKNKKH